ncbi:hypothetical protein Sjap_025573 [Stephania japonica]|uniref:Leucine-rich repeat-containing N-terminal plant-type domain-containing protein n=1 Tax=Stephania japonica TaxID=461633 RepID=A0AAP0E5F9_9MAGN
MERVCGAAVLCFWVFFTLTGSHQAFGCLKEERHALLLVKAEFNTPYGNSLGSWNSMNSDDCCAWERIKCDNRTGRVIEIYLNETKQFESNVSNHSWYLSASLFLPFKELQSLDLSNNYLSGWAESDVRKSVGGPELSDVSTGPRTTCSYAIESKQSLRIESSTSED